MRRVLCLLIVYGFMLAGIGCAARRMASKNSTESARNHTADNSPVWAVQLNWSPNGNSSLQVQYNSKIPTLAGISKPTKAIFADGQTNVWHTYTWKLTNVNFGGRENAGADLRISGSPGMAVHKVVLSLQPPVQSGDTHHKGDDATASITFDTGKTGMAPNNTDHNMRQMAAGGNVIDSRYFYGHAKHRIWLEHPFQFLKTPESAVVSAGVASVSSSPKKFCLKNGDRVVFYGDSITEQRFYTTDVELYVRTRFPDLHIRFVNSGVGGDTVNGGWAGPINLRLKRDVFAFKPDVVTIMLGMNDGGYQSFNPVLFHNYKLGYEHIIQSLKRRLPGVRIVLIAPSPFDDITHPPQFAGGYNAVLIRYGQFLKSLAAKDHLEFVNFNKPLVNVLEKAEKTDPQLAEQIIPQRVHPDANGQLVMAESLLKAWGAPALVTAVNINAPSKAVVQSDNTTVSALSESKGSLSWTQTDQVLPMPIMDLHENWPQFPPILTPVGAPYVAFAPLPLWTPPTTNWNYINPVTALVVKLCGFYHNLDSETLRVHGLVAPRYTMRINDQVVGSFSKQKLEKGINLARYDTPMMTKAYSVLNQIWHETQIRFYIWRLLQLPLEKSRYTFNNSWPFVGLPLENSKPQMKTAHSLIHSLYHNLFKTEESRFAQMGKPVPCAYTLNPAAVKKPALTGVIYQDAFKGGALTALNGCKATSKPRHNIQWVAAEWNADGSTTAAGNAYLPFTPISGNIYKLSVGLNPEKGASTGWLAIGFVGKWTTGANHPNTGVTAFFANGAIAAGPWAAVYPDRGSGGSAQGGGGGGATVVGPGATGITRWATTDGVQQIAIVLNTTGPVWTYQVSDNGVVVTPCTPLPANPTITGVGLGNAQITKGTASDFRLTVKKQ